MVVVPLRIARGIQNKVLEALAVGKPVIASPQALEGLAIKPGEHAVQADTPSQWATAIFQLMDNAPYRRRLASAGRMLVCKNHHWENCLAPLAKSLDVHLSSA
jgi:glycosyltransferase involved in cell wall biosynthesis